MVDKSYCMSSFLMFRTVIDETKAFANEWSPLIHSANFERDKVANSADLEKSIKTQMEELTKDGKAALALSGGIDSAILAKYMPKGSKAYTFQCIVPGIDVTNEAPQAQKYAEENGLEHEVIPIYWEDNEKYAPVLMKHKRSPIHSIEVQIYKAALKAKEDGYERLIFGENADIIYGGMTGLLKKDWTFGEFVDRYTYVMPYKVLKDPTLILEPYKKYEERGHCDAYAFTNEYFRREALDTYNNACETAGIEFAGPFSNTYLEGELDLARIRAGEGKYIIRELFNKLYPGWSIPEKLPMPRATNEWFRDWKGPMRPEFYEDGIDGFTGDQKWLVWSLERFLNLIEE